VKAHLNNTPEGNKRAPRIARSGKNDLSILGISPEDVKSGRFTPSGVAG